MIETAAKQFGLTDIAALPPQTGYRNWSHPLRLPDGQHRNLIVYKSEAGILTKIRSAHQTAASAAAAGLPVRTPADPRILVLRSPHRTRYAALYHYLPGTTIPWEAYTSGHIKLTGLALSYLHRALQDAPVTGLPSVIGQYTAIIGRLSAYFARTDVAQALQAKLHLKLRTSYLARALHVLAAAAPLPVQPLHMDFVRGNLLFGPAASHPGAPLHFNNLALTGIIDFEKTALGHPAFDVARTLAFLIVDCPKSEVTVRRYFLHSGYNKRGPSRLAPSRLLDELINLFLVYDFYKFLHHNPYESLALNHHFRRTRNLLLSRGILIES